jgi:hypothetical protein
MIAYTGFHNTYSGTNAKFDWYHEAYGYKNARTLHNKNGAYKTFQEIMCSTGGGQTFNGYHQWFDGTAVTLDQSHEYEIGRIWGTGTSSGSTVTTNLSFNVSAGPASIGASVGVTTGQGTYTGTIQKDPKFHLPSSWTSWQRNEVNAFFVSPHTYPWDGTDSYEGNNSEVLYEWPMGTSTTFHVYTRGHIDYWCVAIGGC